MTVLDIDDLRFKAPPGKRLVVLGDPIGHSLSPAMHNAALAKMSQVDPTYAEWSYEAVHVPSARLAEALASLHREQVVGINLTIPHKVDALSLVEDVDPEVRPMGAVNTLIRTPHGYRGTNTDGYGILKAVEEAFSIRVGGRDVWLFGAGGAARGIAVACLRAGCHRLTMVNRGAERLQMLRGQLALLASAFPAPQRYFTMEDVWADAEPEALIINATALGLKETDPPPILENLLSSGVTVYDTTYGVSNQLGKLCRERGIAYADGLSMLIWQGVRSLEIWTGAEVPEEAMRRAACTCLQERAATHG